MRAFDHTGAAMGSRVATMLSWWKSNKQCEAASAARVGAGEVAQAQVSDRLSDDEMMAIAADQAQALHKREAA